ncbi:hypothetical protein EVAR_18736_1 [Eumeta japonica]|uniref:Uncharacterized protein n=1 Tax=Eumeta variegata TaxID=151549 RepID=A0A4C1UM52_EUMVA|nr:hypothetical protein EVAR_18736_1 [Eumeta japonica]
MRSLHMYGLFLKGKEKNDAREPQPNLRRCHVKNETHKARNYRDLQNSDCNARPLTGLLASVDPAPGFRASARRAHLAG